MKYWIVAFLVLASACTGESKPPVPKKSVDSPPASKPLTEPIQQWRPPDPEGSDWVEPIATLIAEDKFVHSLVTWSHYVAWLGDNSDRKGSRVVVHDLDKALTRTIVSGISKEGGGPIVRGIGDTVVYTDYARIPCDDDPESEDRIPGCSIYPRPWKIMAVDLITGAQQVLGENRKPKGEGFSPEDYTGVLAEWPWVVWEDTAARTEQGVPIVASNLSTGNKRTVLPPADSWSLKGIENGILYYTDFDKKDSFFQVSVDGSAPSKAITGLHSGFVANGAVTWQDPEPIMDQRDPKADTGNRELWVQPLYTKDPPMRLGVGRYGNPFPVDGFVVFNSPKDRFVARDPYVKGDPLTLYPASAQDWWAYGDRVVWSAWQQEPGGHRPTAIHVMRLRKD